MSVLKQNHSIQNPSQPDRQWLKLLSEDLEWLVMIAFTKNSLSRDKYGNLENIVSIDFSILLAQHFYFNRVMFSAIV